MDLLFLSWPVESFWSFPTFSTMYGFALSKLAELISINELFIARISTAQHVEIFKSIKRLARTDGKTAVKLFNITKLTSIFNFTYIE